MKHILDFEKFNENFINKSIKAINKILPKPAALVEADRLAKEHVAEIMNDYEKRNDLYRVFIRNSSDEFKSITYKISEKENTFANVIDGDAKSFTFTWRNFADETSDLGNLKVKYDFSRSSVNPEPILYTNEDSIYNNQYHPISNNIAKTLIDFFIGEYVNKYPILKDAHYFNYMTINELERNGRTRVAYKNDGGDMKAVYKDNIEDTDYEDVTYKRLSN
jgi:hypothetical protein